MCCFLAVAAVLPRAEGGRGGKARGHGQDKVQPYYKTVWHQGVALPVRHGAACS
jgi:hypothetical protein